MRTQDEEAHDFGIELLKYRANGEEIAQRLRHLFVVDTHKTVMHPVIHEGTLMRALGLGDFVFVMWKLQILPAAMNVKMIAEQLGTHR